MKTRKTFTTFLLGIIMCLATCFGVMFSKPTTDVVATTQAEATYTTKDVAMMGRVAGWHGNGNFEIRLTLGEADWSTEETKTYAGEADLPTALRKLDFFNKIKLGDKTLAEWGCTACYSNTYWLNSGGPKYTLMIPLAMGSDNMAQASAAGIRSDMPFTILEGALIPSNAYLQGNTSATVYRAGCTYETVSADVDYGIMAIAKTDVESIQYVTGWDSTWNNAYLGVSLKGDDYAADGVQTEVNQANYQNALFMNDRFPNKITVDGAAGKTEGYGLFNLGSKGKGYFSFVIRAQEETSSAITIPAGTMFPSYAMTNLRNVNGNSVYIIYQTQTDVTFYKQADGTWQKPMTEIETTVESAFVSGSENDNFTFIKLGTHDYPTDIDNWGGGTVKEWIKNSNFCSHVLIDDVELTLTGEALLNVWGNKGVVAFRTAKGISASKITILAGCQFPTYNAVTNGARECYVTTEDITFEKNANGEWVMASTEKPAKEIETDISKMEFSEGFAILYLTNNDYPTDAGTIDVKALMSTLHFYDHIEVDGKMVATDLVDIDGAFINVWRRYGSFATYLPGKSGHITPTATVVIKAGAQIPTYNALVNGANEYYVVSEDVTFVYRNEQWVKSANITFVADGNTVASFTYTKEFGIEGEVPAVPAKDGYDGKWESYTLTGGNIVVNAVYTEKAKEIPTEVTSAFVEGTSDSFTFIKIAPNDYPQGIDNWGDNLVKNWVKNSNFFTHVLIDGVELGSPAGEVLLNVWGNKGVIAFRTSKGSAATEITVLAGCQIPTYNAIANGANEYYVVSEDATFVLMDGKWVKPATISFVINGTTVATLPYTAEFGIEGEIPEIPHRDGYVAQWESYTLNGKDLVVNAVYTKRTFTEVETNISKMEFAEGFVILYLTNNDYPTNAGTIDVKTQLSSMHFFDYLVVDGKIMASGLYNVDGAFINVWDRFGSIATYLPGHIEPQQSVVIKKGAQIPSNGYRLDASNKTCYVLKEDVTFLYENGVWVRQGEIEVESIMPEYENNYILSDLFNSAYPSSSELEKGYLYVNSDTNGNVYGYNVSQSFSITFDFSLNLGDKDLSALGNYTTFSIAMATRGYSWAKGFGWNFYLYRPGNSNKCIEFFVGGEGKGTWEEVGYFEKGQTYRVTLGYKLIDKATGTVETFISVNGVEAIREIVLGADYYNSIACGVDSIAFATSSAVGNCVLITDPDMTAEDVKYNLTLTDGVNTIVSKKAWKYTLPELSAYKYASEGEVFIGWTTNASTVETLYPAGYTLELTGDTTLYPVWMYFNMQKGAAVRTVKNESGIRFLVDVDGNAYNFGVNSGLIVGAGTLVVPTAYLEGGAEFVHETFDVGYYVDVPTSTWSVQSGDVWTYAAALINISSAQYARSMSARGYLKIAYSDGTEGYVYTSYNGDWNSRSIYDVATAAYKDNIRHEAVLDYVNNVADLVLDGGFAIKKNENSVGDYTVEDSIASGSFTAIFNKPMKAIIINGTRIIAGYDAEIVVNGYVYNVSNYTMTADGTSVTFIVDTGDMVSYYSAIAEYYANSDAYTELYKNEIMSILSDWEGDYSDAEANAEFANKLASVKTAEDLRANVGESMLATPVVSYGLGYAVTWNAVANADYYVVVDDNDYREYSYVLANNALTYSYKPEVIGKHNVTVTAHSFNKAFKPSNASESFATVEVKPVFSYKAMYDGLYKFSADNMVKMGIVGSTSELNTKNDGSSFYYDKTEKQYFAYYNKETGWSKNEGFATDWTSPAEFPAHAARLKAMGNNVIMMSEGSVASLGENDVWENSRMKYIMDTAWTMGMKVIVCDDVLYQQSKEVGSKSAAMDVINGRMSLMEKYINHPAFYGFSLEDEPEPNSLFTGSEMESVGFMIQALKETCANLGYSKANGNEPFFLACLYQYSSGFESFGAIVGYEDYLQDWFDGTALDYVYVDLYTGHAMGDNTNRYEMTYDVVYGNGTNGILGTDKEFYQVITAHTQSKDKDGTLTEADMYMSMLYAAAHNVAGYSWFCYFPILTEMAGSMVGVDGNGLGNGIGNIASGSYYNAAATAGYQYEVIQGIMNGYKLASRAYSNNLLTTTLTKSGAANITMYVNADTMNMSATTMVTAAGSKCYLIGKGIGSTEMPYQLVSGSVTLQPGQAVICVA